MGGHFNRSGKRSNPGGPGGHRVKEMRKKQRKMAKLLAKGKMKGVDPNLAKKLLGQ